MSPHRELANPPELHPAPGFSHVAIASGTAVVHLAGQVALDPQFGIVGGDDLGEQTKAAMRNDRLSDLDAVMAQAVRLKFLDKPLSKEQFAELIQIPPP